jgi:hypothetical protein
VRLGTTFAALALATGVSSVGTFVEPARQAQRPFTLLAASSVGDQMQIQHPVTVTGAASALIDRYRLGGIVERVTRAVFAETNLPMRPSGLALSADPEWNSERPRLLITIEFPTNLADAYRAWKELYAAIEPISGAAEDGETLTFDFVGQSV